MTARREFWAEVPAIRSYRPFHLEPLTHRMFYGPVKSLSRGYEVQYELQFFLVRIDQSPETLVEMTGTRTKNLWVAQRELIRPSSFRVSQLVGFLDRSLGGGLDAIP
jgi:hypothetical protein